MSFIPPDPDWNRVLVHTDQKLKAVGDPTLWANTVTTLIDGPGFTPPAVIFGEQIVAAKAGDSYARAWSVIGALTLPRVSWEFAGPAVPPTSPTPANSLSVFLSVSLGIEKVTIEHRICLMSGSDPGNIGLCNNQCTRNGGPYLPVFRDTPPTDNSDESRAFAIIGGLVGNSVSIRGVFVRGVEIPGEDGILVPYARITCMLTPYAAGTGL